MFRALPRVVWSKIKPQRSKTSFILYVLSLCFISGIFQCKPGQSLCRWSQHFRVSDSQPREPHCATVRTAMGAARWKRIPRSPKRSSEGTGALQGPYTCRTQRSNHPLWSSAYQLLHFYLPSPPSPPLLAFIILFRPPTPPRFPLPSSLCISPSNRYIDRQAWAKVILQLPFTSN